MDSLAAIQIIQMTLMPTMDFLYSTLVHTHTHFPLGDFHIALERKRQGKGERGRARERGIVSKILQCRGRLIRHSKTARQPVKRGRKRHFSAERMDEPKCVQSRDKEREGRDRDNFYEKENQTEKEDKIESNSSP